jgi:hypothetical protein
VADINDQSKPTIVYDLFPLFPSDT